MKDQEELIAIMNFNAEMIEKAKVAKTAEELYENAKANGVELTADEAKTYFEQISSCQLDEDLLEGVAGGWIVPDDNQDPSYERIGKSSRSQCG